MKTTTKKNGASDLPRFVIGAIATAGASAANGATVQITFLNNVVSSVTGVTNFTPDLTGDGVDEALAGTYAVAARALLKTSINATGAGVLGGGLLTYGNAFAAVGGAADFGPATATKTGLVAFTFTDLRVNNGTPTNGWLDLTASADLDAQVYSLQINRLIFDDSNASAPVVADGTVYNEWVAIPEPSSIALLALGAGGLTLRRRRQRAA